MPLPMSTALNESDLASPRCDAAIEVYSTVHIDHRKTFVHPYKTGKTFISLLVWNVSQQDDLWKTVDRSEDRD